MCSERTRAVILFITSQAILYRKTNFHFVSSRASSFLSHQQRQQQTKHTKSSTRWAAKNFRHNNKNFMPAKRESRSREHRARQVLPNGRGVLQVGIILKLLKIMIILHIHIAGNVNTDSSYGAMLYLYKPQPNEKACVR